MNEIEMALLRHERRKEQTTTSKTSNHESNAISICFTKILLSVIFLLSSIIYIKFSPENEIYFKQNLFESNLTFAKINNWYHENFGNILPSVSTPNDTLVSSDSGILNREPYLDGYKIKSNTAVESLASGILVFMGEKEGYGNTLIIQGVDGVDIWYGNIIDVNLKLYDYLDAKSILGNSNGEYYILFQKDGAFITYEEYFS